MDTRAEVGAFSVVDVMRTDIFTLTPETPVIMARRIANEKRIDHLLVLDGGILAGIVSQHDLRLNDKDALVRDCMSSPVLCVGPETTLQDASEIMAEQGVSCLPVVIGASLVGMITETTLAGLGFGPQRPSARFADAACAACGTRDRVRSRRRAKNLPLCASCTSRVVPPLPEGSFEA